MGKLCPLTSKNMTATVNGLNYKSELKAIENNQTSITIYQGRKVIAGTNVGRKYSLSEIECLAIRMLNDYINQKSLF